MKIFDKLPEIDFMKYKHIALSITWGLILLCFFYVRPWNPTSSKVKLGMQFTGGIDMTVRFRNQVRDDQVRGVLQKTGISNASVVAYVADESGAQDFSIKVPALKGQDEKDSSAQIKKITDAVKSLDPDAKNPKMDLNTLGTLALADQFQKTNPLNLNLEDVTSKHTYEMWAGRVISQREKLGFLKTQDQIPTELPQVLKDTLSKEFRMGVVSILKSESFSPSISGEWTRKTLQAVGWALAAILVYVMFRFTTSFAVGGIVALIHDVLAALGLFAVFGFEFSVPVVASFLILLGYSMSDTIVVFDRIRENSHKPEYRKVSISKLINDSINQTLSRTILTSMSVLFVSLCLFVWGGPALRDLSFPIFIGVITGTYSSIYIASPVVVYWDQWFGGKDKLKQHVHS